MNDIRLMQKVLIPIDGSAHSTKAVRFVSNLMQDCGHLEIHVANIVARLGAWQKNIIDEKCIDSNHVERGYRILSPALNILDECNVSYRVHIGQGDPAEVLIEMANRLRCDSIVMGVRCPEGAGGQDMGPVARNLLRLSKVSVICVK